MFRHLEVPRWHPRGTGCHIDAIRKCSSWGRLAHMPDQAKGALALSASWIIGLVCLTFLINLLTYLYKIRQFIVYYDIAN